MGLERSQIPNVPNGLERNKSHQSTMYVYKCQMVLKEQNHMNIVVIVVVGTSVTIYKCLTICNHYYYMFFASFNYRWQTGED